MSTFCRDQLRHTSVWESMIDQHVLLRPTNAVPGIVVEALDGNAYEVRVYDMELGSYFCFCKNK
jgi:hypothetical protein